MSRESELTIGFALVIAMGCGVSNAAAQTDKYPRMAAIGQYLMEKNAEIQLARSAAPDSISRDATILVLGRQGYETAVEGKNGFVCMVERGWMAAFDWPEFWNPKVRAADCLNPQAARSILPIAFLRSRMVMAGRSKAEILSAIKAAFENRQLPLPFGEIVPRRLSKVFALLSPGSRGRSSLCHGSRAPSAGRRPAVTDHTNHRADSLPLTHSLYPSADFPFSLPLHFTSGEQLRDGE